MKKLLCVMMYGMVFGQDAVTSKFYTIDVDGQDYQWVELNSVTGYNQSWYIVEVIDENVGCRVSMDGGVTDSDSNHRHDGNADFMLANNFATSTEPIYLIDSNPRLRIGNFDNCVGEIYASITSNFPEEDTGYIEEGFDYCIDVGANLIASPCRDAVPILDTLPSEIANNLTGIIGQGVAANNQNGTWIGSLDGLGGGNGYWFKSNVSACFNYNCAEN